MSMPQLSVGTTLADLIAAKNVQDKQFPLSYLLLLYFRSHPKDTYCKYFHGFKLLHEWLSPIAIPDISPVQVPKLCGSYELQEISIILGISQNKLYAVILDMTAKGLI